MIKPNFIKATVRLPPPLPVSAASLLIKGIAGHSRDVANCRIQNRMTFPGVFDLILFCFTQELVPIFKPKAVSWMLSGMAELSQCWNRAN
ncbi:hypothetical protein AVEN_54918-1 [Araneus ventricosus]|uniref:Uncharacterized protein n=1 Tax=Araneus ventricosus TaxID=182803 RepID=A0A4Y2T4D4_ARAVE|nr:hypothetical protein AVEN_54918-1 [Araneus ventricosus]